MRVFIKFNIIILILFSLLTLPNETKAQTGTAPELLTQGINYYKSGNYTEASRHFNMMIKKFPSNANVMYWYARCYEEEDQKLKAADLYLKAYKTNKNAGLDILYRVGRAYQIKSDFKQALNFYKQYKAILKPEFVKNLNSTMDYEQLRVDKMISECESGIKLSAKPSRHAITNLGKLINTPYEEYTPLISADNKKLFFTSRRPGGVGNEKDSDNEFFEDIWYSVKDSKGNWKKPVNLGDPINSASHDACIALSPDGKQLFVYNTSNGGDIYVSDFKDNKWSKPKSIGKKINSKFKEPSLSISADNNTIFFSSDRKGGLGGLDIYFSKKNANGEWDEPVNLGPNINTPFEDDGPFISFNGKVLYFCSNGHNSMGGFDVFCSNYDEKTNTWSKPINLGFPINSPDDDIFFVIAADKKTAYYASGKKGGYGEKDIFTINIDTAYLAPPKPKPSTKKPDPQIAKGNKNTSLILLSNFEGKITDEKGSPLECIISIKKYNSEEKAKDYVTKPDGSFSIPLNKGFIYSINAQKSGFMFLSHSVDLTSSISSATLKSDFKLIKPKEGQKIILKNISYQIGKASLTKSSYHEVNLLFDYLSKNNNIKIEISGHTDNLGSKELNKQISTERAKTIYDILVKKGINPNRLRYAGYGSERPIASNSTADGKRKNRRTEFEITDL